jgi:aerobic C4-dicarboxylate transport protein
MSRKPLYQKLSVQILIAMLLGALLGHLFPNVAESIKPLSVIFIRLVTMLVSLIIFCIIVHGIAGVQEARSAGRIAVKAIVLFEIVTTLALIIGMIMVNLLAPGSGMHIDPASLNDQSVQRYAATAKHLTVADFFLDMVPKTAVGAFAQGEMLQVLVFSLLFAVGVSAVGARAAPIVSLVESLQLVLYRMIGFVMKTAPIGAFAAIAYTVGRFGITSLLPLSTLIAEFYACAIVFVLVVFWPIARLSGISLFQLVRYIWPELLIVFGTSSTESVFPQLIAKLRTLGCQESVVGIVLPTSYAFNHSGTCLYFATASIFLAQAVDVHLTLTQQLGLLAIMLITSKAGGGVAGSSFVILTMTIGTSGLIPIGAVGIILGIHILLSSVFVPVTVLGNALATIAVARWEGALDRGALKRELGRGATAQHEIASRFANSTSSLEEPVSSAPRPTCATKVSHVAVTDRPDSA